MDSAERRSANDCARKQSEPKVICAQDVPVEAVDFLWKPYLPAGKITILAGEPGLGKTWLACAIAAAVTNGRLSGEENAEFPGGQPVKSGSVVYLSGEDGAGDTLRPRLESFGADLAKVFLRNEADPDPIRIQDSEGLNRIIEASSPCLLIIDPIQAFLGNQVDMNKANEVRVALSKVHSLAVRCGVGVLLVGHLRKGAAEQALHRVLGSTDFVASARSVLMVGSHPNDPDVRLVSHAKMNLAAKGSSFGFSLDDRGFRWTGIEPYSADEIIADTSRCRTRTSTERAKGFLRAELSCGSKKKRRDLISGGKRLKLSESTICRAFRELKGHSFRGGEHSEAWWSLVTELTELTEQTNHENTEASAPVSTFIQSPTPRATCFTNPTNPSPVEGCS